MTFCICTQVCEKKHSLFCPFVVLQEFARFLRVLGCYPMDTVLWTHVLVCDHLPLSWILTMEERRNERLDLRIEFCIFDECLYPACISFICFFFFLFFFGPFQNGVNECVRLHKTWHEIGKKKKKNIWESVWCFCVSWSIWFAQVYVEMEFDVTFHLANIKSFQASHIWYNDKT